jgi:hypothetical protein
LQYWGGWNNNEHLQFCSGFVLENAFQFGFLLLSYHQFFNLALVLGGRFSNSPTSQSPARSYFWKKAIIFADFLL